MSYAYNKKKKAKLTKEKRKARNKRKVERKFNK